MSFQKIAINNKIGINDNQFELDFSNNNIITFVGKNGSGKSKFLTGLNTLINDKKYSIDRDNQSSVNFDVSISLKEFNNIWNKSSFSNLKESDSINQSIIAHFKEVQLINFNTFKSLVQAKYYKLFNNNVISKLDKSKYQNLDLIKTKFENIKDDLNDLDTKFINFLKGYQLNEFEKLINTYTYNLRLLIDTFYNALFDVESIYIDCLKQNSIPLENQIDLIFLNNKYVVSVNSLYQFKLLYNLLQQSNISLKDFRTFSIEQIMQLNTNSEFQESINNWISSLISQPLKISIFFQNENNKLKTTINIIDSFSKQKLSINDLSSGTKTFFNLINQFSKINEQVLIIIDEPETGMHAGLQIKFYDYLIWLSSKTKAKLIISTHSNFFIPDQKDSIYISHRFTKSRTNEILPIDKFKQKNGILSNDILEFIYYQPYYINQEYSKNGWNIIVEGESDIYYLNKWLEIFDIKEEVKILKPPSYQRGYSGTFQAYEILNKLDCICTIH